MITLIEGLPGAGKSYEATTRHVLPALFKKEVDKKTSKFQTLKDSLLAFLPKKKKKDENDEARYIVTNLPLNLDYIEKQGYDTTYIIKLESKRVNGVAHRPFSFLSDITDYENMKVRENGLGPLYIIDECQIIFPPTTPSDDTYRDFENWFTEHRHSSSDVVLITQNWDQINKKIAKLTQVKKRLKKLNTLSLNNSYKAFYFDNVRLSAATATYRQEMRRYKKEYFGFYSSYTKGGNGEAGIQDQKAVWRSWKVYLAVLFIFYAIYKVATFDTSLFSGSEKDTSNIATERHKAMLQASSNRVPAPVQSVQPVVEEKACEHPFSDYEFSYSHTKDDRFFFHIYKNERKLDSVFSSTQLRHNGYILSSVYFEDVKDVYENRYYTPEFHTLPKRVEVKVHEKAEIFNAVLKYKECPEFSSVITHVMKEQPQRGSSFNSSPISDDENGEQQGSLLDIFNQ